ncbi:hypothetical protein Cgig2_007867 [Carnegiea gigantea]|uniref:Uncharacterized protein n=1 Tax=Carnegiea gigantea TaxID=171969 RepID=A0A9Q1KFQ6_9CARY|nr:hypothetical protein Cgig2_007867 [Carnegiea gigantea]
MNGSQNRQTTSEDVDVREEYANAFRTESYNEFWARVLALTQTDSATWKLEGSTSATRLLSYRLFGENLLDPDQPTVTKMLSLTKIQLENKALIFDYFETTTNASTLCGLLLKDVDQMRIKYRSLRKTLSEISRISSNSKNTQLPTILTRLTEFTKCINPFVSSSTSLTRFKLVKLDCSELLRRLESSRDKARSKLQLLTSLRQGAAIFLVALTTALTLIVVTHALAIAVAMPGFVVASLSRGSMKQLAKTSAQLDAATKGTYILNKDLDTVSRLLARLDDEMEHTRAMIGFWMDRTTADIQAQAGEEVARQLKDSSSFVDQLDELEEHLYLCFMTINRARKLVVKEILDLHPS